MPLDASQNLKVDVVAGSVTSSATPDAVTSGTLTTTSGAGSTVTSGSLSGMATAAFGLVGSPVGATVIVEATQDPTGAAGWLNVLFEEVKTNGYQMAEYTVSSPTASPSVLFLSVAGFALVRVRMTALTSGSLVVTLRVSAQAWGATGIQDRIQTDLTLLSGQLPAALAGSGSLPVLDDNSAAALADAATTAAETTTIAGAIVAGKEQVTVATALPAGTATIGAVTGPGAAALATAALEGAGLPAALAGSGSLKTLDDNSAAAAASAVTTATKTTTIAAELPASLGPQAVATALAVVAARPIVDGPAGGTVAAGGRAWRASPGALLAYFGTNVAGGASLASFFFDSNANPANGSAPLVETSLTSVGANASIQGLPSAGIPVAVAGWFGLSATFGAGGYTATGASTTYNAVTVSQ